MFNPRITALIAATAAAGFAGATIAGAADPTASTPSASSSQRGPAGGPGGGKCADLAAIATTLGVTEAKLRAAVEAARPEKPANWRDRGAAMAADIAKALGERTADVQAVLAANRPAGRGPRGGGDHTALVAALAKRFSISEAKAQAAVDAAHEAHEAKHEQREDAMFAAIAKALGKDAAAVEQAFEANRPPRP